MRQHDRFTLRMLACATVIASLVLNSLATRAFYYHPAHSLTLSAYLPVRPPLPPSKAPSLTTPQLSLSFLWHLLDLHAMRSDRRLRIWILAIVESALAAAFATLSVVGMVMIWRPHFWYGLDTVGRTVLMTWETGVWLGLG